MKTLLSHSLDSYDSVVEGLLREAPLELAMARAVGSSSMGDFVNTGDIQVEVLRHHGLSEGMRAYDLGCGSGRTAQALERAGWRGEFAGADINARMVDYFNMTCQRLRAAVNKRLTILAPNASLDMVYHWSVFTHIFPEECFVYMKDISRALRPGGRHIFSFMEIDDQNHYSRIFKMRAERFEKGLDLAHLDTFLHRDWIRAWAQELGFSEPQFTDGSDTQHHRRMWQTVASMQKKQELGS
jgi:SAM-dependent methyltransferase